LDPVKSEFLDPDSVPQGLDLQHRSAIAILQKILSLPRNKQSFRDGLEILIERLIYFRDSAYDAGILME
jgi:hypothetical protein